MAMDRATAERPGGNGDEPLDTQERHLAERRLLAALRRAHRREPLRPDIRVDALIAAARAVPPGRAPTHRGSARLTLDDRSLLRVIDGMVASGQVIRSGRRVRLAEHVPAPDGEMRERVDRLLEGLRAAGPEPPRVDGIAARLGIPAGVLQQLRSAGELVPAGPGIDYPADTWASLRARLQALSASGPLTVGRVRQAMRISRRHATAILALRREEAARSRSVRRRAPAGGNARKAPPGG
jgi:hypothetical protein